MGDHDIAMEGVLALHQPPPSTLAIPESIVQTDLARVQSVLTYALSLLQEGMHHYSEPNAVALLRGKVTQLESEARNWHDGIEREVALASQRSRQQLEEAQHIGQRAYDREAHIAKDAEMHASTNARVAIGAEHETGHLQNMLEVAKSQSQQVAEKFR